MLLHARGLPAAFLVGPMLCAIVASLCGSALRLPRRGFIAAQALIGCTVAESISASIVVMIAREWPLICLAVASTVLAGGFVGWLLVRLRTLPGTTAAWGLIPGGASAMVAMAEEYGADARLVALMQYLRLLIVVLTASSVAHLLLDSGATPPVTTPPFAFGSVQAIASTLALAAGGAFLAQRLRIPAGAMLVPLVLGALLHATELLSARQPFWMQAAAATLLGWHVGLGFNRAILISAFRLLPRLVFSALCLIGLCALAGWALAVLLGTDPLTAYLATSPGGLDSIVLIAIGSQADVSFVVAVQTLRLVVVILTGPAIARAICRHA